MNQHWLFWKKDDSVELQQAKAALNEAQRQRAKMDALAERNRRVRTENHLGEAVMKSVLARGKHP